MSEAEAVNPFQSPLAPQASQRGQSDDIFAQGKLDAKTLELAFQVANPTWASAASTIVIWFLFVVGLATLQHELVTGLVIMLVPAPLYFSVVAATNYLAYRRPIWQANFQRVADAPETQRFQLNAEFLKIESASVRGYFSWSQLTGLVAGGDVIVLTFDSERLILLPIYFFASDDDYRVAGRLASQAYESLRPAAPADWPPLSLPAPKPGSIAGGGVPTWREYYVGKSRLDLAPPHVWLLIAALLLGVASFAPWDLHWMFSWWRIAIMTVAGSFALLIFADAVGRLKQLVPQFRRCVRLARTELCVNAEEVRYATPLISETFAWQDLSRLAIRRSFIVAVFRRNSVLTIARRYFESDEDWRQVVAWARQPLQPNEEN